MAFSLICHYIDFSANGELVVWVCGLDPWDALMKGVGYERGILRIPNHWVPNHQFTT